MDTAQTDRKPLTDARAYCPTLTLRKVTEEGAWLVDVREPEETAALAFDVPNLVQMPLSEFERRYAELPRDRELILACSAGARSLKATYFLMYHGYTQVAYMEGGLDKWLRKGFPVRGDGRAADATCNCAPAGAAASGCCTPAPASGGCC